jgi:hypothetical protein
MREVQVRRLGMVTIAIATVLLASSCGEQRATAPSGASAQLLNTGPNLVECPTNQTLASLQVPILPDVGGSVEVAGSSITIPAGAISAMTIFQVTVPAGRFVEVDVSPINVLDTGPFLFDQDHPATITIDYSRCTRNLSGTPLHVYHIDPLTKQLLEDMGGVDDKLAQRITFTTGHLSGYAIAD